MAASSDWMLGLPAEELDRLAGLCGGAYSGGFDASEDHASSPELAARRLAWQAAAALIAANNRRLTEQLRALGLRPEAIAGLVGEPLDARPGTPAPHDV